MSLSPLFFFTCYVVWTLCLPGCRSVWKILGPKLKYGIEWQYKISKHVAIRSGDSGNEHIFLDINCRKKNSPLFLRFTTRKAAFIHSAFYIVYWGKVYQEEREKTDG